MNPINDIVCSVLETPFSRWRDDDKKDAFSFGRPTPSLFISVRKEHRSRGKSYIKQFKDSWYSENKWLCGSYYLQKLFCWPCLLVGVKKHTWNASGFSDFLNVNRSLHKHADSAEHLKCSLQLKHLEKTRSTKADALKENSRLHIAQFNESVRLNRLFMETVIDAVLYLSKQELAFRGHDESITSLNRGNFRELLSLLISKSSLEIQNHYEKIRNVFSGESKIIQNELIDCISDYMQDYVKNEITGSDFFSVQIDDTTDINQTSQCSVIVRFVDPAGILVERFLGFYNVSSDRTAEALFILIDNVLGEFNYKSKLVGQCYDGASVMSGHLNGLQKRVKDVAPQAVFVHCLAHRLNLVLQQSFKRISKCRIFFANISGIPSFFHHSVKRTYVMDTVVGRRIPTATDVRWYSNGKLLAVIVEEWDGLKAVFKSIRDDIESDQTSIHLARGYLNDMNDFEFSFLSLIFNDIFQITAVLFDVLQKKSLDINFCIAMTKRTTEMIESNRSDSYFLKMFQSARDRAELPEKRHCSVSVEEIKQNYKILLFEILDNIVMQMSVRFQDVDKLKFVCLADASKFEEYCTQFPSDALTSLQECYPSIFKKQQRLRTELDLLYRDPKYYNEPVENLIQLLQNDITSIKTYLKKHINSSV